MTCVCICVNSLCSVREQTGVILLRSVEAALIALSGDTLTAKHRGLYHVYLHNDVIRLYPPSCFEALTVVLSGYMLK